MTGNRPIVAHVEAGSKAAAQRALPGVGGYCDYVWRIVDLRGGDLREW